MSSASRSRAWELVREIEDVLGLLAIVDMRRRMIRRLAWHEGDMGEIYRQATAMKADLEALQGPLSERWAELLEEAKGGRNE